MKQKEKMIIELDALLKDNGCPRVYTELHTNHYIKNDNVDEYVIEGFKDEMYPSLFLFSSLHQLELNTEGKTPSIMCNDIYDDIEESDIFIESTSKNTSIITDKIFPIVSNTLKDPISDRKFRNLIQKFIDRHSSKLYTVGPTELIPFTDFEKNEFFQIFDTTSEEIIKVIVEMTKSVNDKASWKLLRQNPIFCLFYECIRYYTIKKDESGVQVSLCIYALAAYPSVFSVIFPYGANAGVMQYTIDKMSEKFLIKQQGNVFNTLMTSIRNSYKFLKEAIIEGTDLEIIRFVARIRNDQKSLLKNIANVYYDNHKKNLRAVTQNETYGDDQIIDDKLNNTSIVENITRKTVLSIVTNGVNITRATAAARTSKVSISDLRLYLSKIVTEDNAEVIKDFIEAILFIYLYDEQHSVNEINERKFISFTLDLFRRTNSGNKNIVTIKTTLSKWAEESGIVAKFKREGTQSDYKRAIYTYMILCIQYYNS